MLYLVIGGSASGKSEYAERLLLSITGETGNDTTADRKKTLPGSDGQTTDFGKVTDWKRYYIATMQAEDPESRARIAKHQARRAGWGLTTLEIPRNIGQAADLIQESSKPAESAVKKAVLVECISNLLANEMFHENTTSSPAAGGKVTRGKGPGTESDNVEIGCHDADGDASFHDMSGSEASARQAAESIIGGIHNICKTADLVVVVSNNVHEDGVQYDAMTQRYIQTLGTINQRLCAMADAAVEVVCGYPMAVKGELPCMS